MTHGEAIKTMAVALDNLDAEAIRDMLRSRGWELIRSRYRQMIERATRDAMSADGWENFVVQRAIVQALGAILAVPETLIQEATSAKK